MTNSTLRILPEFLNFKRPSEHSLFSPSSADRWLIDGCSFSVNYCKDIPNISSVYSEEGTVAHSVCEALYRLIYFGTPFPVELQVQMMKYDHQEMMDCAHGYVEVITFWLNNTEVIGDVLYYGLEVPVPIFPEEGCFGTGDCIIIGSKASVIIDYKHGRGKNVSASSLQLKVYAAGVLRNLENVPEDYKIHAVVFQPRTDRFAKETSYDLAEMRSFIEKIRQSIEAAKLPNLSPCERNHCYWCPANRTKDPALKCPAIAEKPIKLAQENFNKFLSDMNAPVDDMYAPNPKRDEAIIKLMTLYPLIKRVVEGAQDEFMMRLERGEVINGVRVIQEVGSRMINAESEEDRAHLVQSKFGVNPWKVVPETKKLKTLTEIEKEIGRGKLDPICIKKVSKKLDILDDKMRSILGEMEVYAKMLNNNTDQQE